jgi:hypothetical protein
MRRDTFHEIIGCTELAEEVCVCVISIRKNSQTGCLIVETEAHTVRTEVLYVTAIRAMLDTTQQSHAKQQLIDQTE